MTQIPDTPTRRQALQWSFGLAAGSVLAGCGGSDDGTVDTLPEPPRLAASNRLLALELNAAFSTQTLPLATKGFDAWGNEAKQVATSLRTFNGRYVAPTLELAIGDTLRVQLHNRMPANGSYSRLNYLNHQNGTNLHFHGLHVDPREIRPGVFGDFVVDDPEGGVLPGQSRLHEITIPADHDPGVFWYHPHLHGSATAQVVSGMYGAILVRDPARAFPAANIRERVIHVNKLHLTDAGRTDTLYDAVGGATSGFVLNGVYQPTLVMAPGEVQVWHFINAGSFYPFNPVLEGHTLQAYARDGHYASGYRPLNAATSADFSNAQWPGNASYPGGRWSVLVQASSTPGTYLLRSMPATGGGLEVVARVVVEGPASSMALPPASAIPRRAPITDQELASHGGRQRNLILGIFDKSSTRLPAIPAGEEDTWYVPSGEPVPGFIINAVHVAGDAAPGAVLAPFQSSLMQVQTVALDAVEEWTIHNNDTFYPHPFHLHVNDSYVTKVNGEAVAPYWADTLPVPMGGSITFRMRFTEFKGKFVWHCHALDHEDLGMMQLVEIV